MRLINADEIIYSWVTTPDGKEHDGVTLQSIIEQMPAIDLIQCRDCKHFMKWRDEKSAKKFGQEYECECGRLNCPEPDDFCSKAERR